MTLTKNITAKRYSRSLYARLVYLSKLFSPEEYEIFANLGNAHFRAIRDASTEACTKLIETVQLKGLVKSLIWFEDEDILGYVVYSGDGGKIPTNWDESPILELRFNSLIFEKKDYIIKWQKMK